MYALGNQAGSNGAKKWSGQMQYYRGAFAATVVYQYVNFNTTTARPISARWWPA
ncbi:MAG: hypothetical protein GAK41_01299 [Burkholderia gladioli]|nr:MAG: hypothetical protein GAK41_01299 [Burkholderia gladioli]